MPKINTHSFRIRFLDAIGTVTGSKYLLTNDQKKFSRLFARSWIKHVKQESFQRIVLIGVFCMGLVSLFTGLSTFSSQALGKPHKNNIIYKYRTSIFM